MTGTPGRDRELMGSFSSPEVAYRETIFESQMLTKPAVFSQRSAVFPAVLTAIPLQGRG